MNILKLLQDNKIPYWTEGNNVTPGWINVRCPLCHDSSNHGGFNVTSKQIYYNCWRCGWSPLERVIGKLCSVSEGTAKRLLDSYAGGTVIPKRELLTPEQKNSTLILPGKKLQDIHRQYLLNRGFNPSELIKKYALKGTGPTGSYKYRIIAPIILDGKTVSYQGRDYTDLQRLKYKTCPLTEEIIHHKNIVYNADNIKDKIIVCEGIFDVWKIGDGAVATFGINFTPKQVEFIASLEPSKIYVMYDSEPQAQKQAKKLCSALSGLFDVYNIILKSGDPADLTEEQVNKLKFELDM